MLTKVASLLWSLVCAKVVAYPIDSSSLLASRQANSVLDQSVFLRRAWHSSAVLNGRLYIDGGEFSYASGNGVVYQHSNSLISIDLSKDWTNTSVPVHSVSKNGAPNLKNGGLWVDREGGKLYTGFAGINSLFGNGQSEPLGLWSFTPDSSGNGVWENLNGTADNALITQPRTFNGQVCSGESSGFLLGGAVGNDTADPIPVGGLVSYGFKAHTLKNSTVTGVSTNGKESSGGMVHIPYFGTHGMLLSMGGDGPNSGDDDLVSFKTVRIYDIGRREWSEQETSGGSPLARKNFCMAGTASNNETYEILIYAGWDGNLGPNSVPYDEAFVLTIPGFFWVKASYPALHPRHGLSCNAVGRGQILTIGGVDTTQDKGNNPYEAVFDTPDPFPHGLAVFDMHTLSWKDKYVAKPGSYSVARGIKAYYDANGRRPTHGFASPNVEALFSHTNFNADDDPDSASTTPAHRHSNIGVIAGVVVGGVVAACLVGIVVLVFRRRRRRQRQREEEEAARPSRDPSSALAAGKAMSPASSRGTSRARPSTGKRVVSHELHEINRETEASWKMATSNQGERSTTVQESQVSPMDTIHSPAVAEVPGSNQPQQPDNTGGGPDELREMSQELLASTNMRHRLTPITDTHEMDSPRIGTAVPMPAPESHATRHELP